MIAVFQDEIHINGGIMVATSLSIIIIIIIIIVIIIIIEGI